MAVNRYEQAFLGRRGSLPGRARLVLPVLSICLALVATALLGCGGDSKDNKASLTASAQGSKPPGLPTSKFSPPSGKAEETPPEAASAPKPPKAKAPSSSTPHCTIRGSARRNVIKGTNSADVICAGAGNDVVRSRGGNDYVLGGAGNDKIDAGDGDDTIDGGDGSDQAVGGNGVDIGIRRSGDTFRQVETLQASLPSKPTARAAGNSYTFGQWVCGQKSNSTAFYFTQKPAVGGPGWVTYWNGYSKRQADGRWPILKWHGPWYYNGGLYPGYYYYGPTGTWYHYNQGGGFSMWSFDPWSGGSGEYLGYQYIQFSDKSVVQAYTKGQLYYFNAYFDSDTCPVG
jgi:hypothetical protein